MTSSAQRDELHRAIWAIANEVRGAVDGWDFKQFVLGTLFYRFISENFTSYMEGGDPNINYAAMDDNMVEASKEEAIKAKGYFIYPSQLFENVAKNASKNEELNSELFEILKQIETSAAGYPSEKDFKGLFADFDTTSPKLGSTVEEKKRRLAAIILGIKELNFGEFEDNQIDLFGDAYEFLISNYAANAGKSGGEFFTPQSVSKLIARLAMHGQTSINKIYDPACGSGSLLLQAKKQFDDHIIDEGFYGQEINSTTYNLARMNMFLHNINYSKFSITLGDTLLNPAFGDEKPFDAIVSNPPYSIRWIGSDDPTLINDPRFEPASVLAPKSKADFAFILHCLHYLSANGRAAIVCFPGIFYRGGAEQRIRKHLVDCNYVETVIALGPNLFFGTSIAVNILVLSKQKASTAVQFIDASGEEFYRKENNNNVLSDEHIERIMRIFDSKRDEEHVAISVKNEDIGANDYNLSVSSYVTPRSTREEVDIDALNAELATVTARSERLRREIDAIIRELGGGESKINSVERLLARLCPAGVEWVPLGEVCSFRRGTTITKRQTTPGKIPVISGGQEPAYYHNVANRTGETIAVAGSGAYSGFISYWKKPIYLSDAFSIHPDNRLTPKYVFYFLKNQQSAIYATQTGSGVPHVHGYNIARFAIPLPPLAVQEEIVRILDKFTELQAKLQAELQAELQLRHRQYEYYRNALLSFT